MSAGRQRWHSSYPVVGAMALVSVLLGLAVPAPSAAQAASGASDVVDAVVLIHHPKPDTADPLGVAFGTPGANGSFGDTFSSRYRPLVADVGRFDYPYFVADGVRSVRALPDPSQPYAATLGAYEEAVSARAKVAPAASLLLDVGSSAVNGTSALSVQVQVRPAGQVADPQGQQQVHLLAAVVEDPVHYKPADAAVSNGVTEHRFTVRSLRDLGPIDLAGGAPSERSATLRVDPAWAPERLHVAVWLQADDAPGRFAPREVLQAALAQPGSRVEQATKAVLVEGYSATWCDPCLYGDLALEQVAITHGGAAKLAPRASSYFQGWTPPLAAGALLGAAGVLLLARSMRRRA